MEGLRVGFLEDFDHVVGGLSRTWIYMSSWDGCVAN